MMNMLPKGKNVILKERGDEEYNSPLLKDKFFSACGGSK